MNTTQITVTFTDRLCVGGPRVVFTHSVPAKTNTARARCTALNAAYKAFGPAATALCTRHVGHKFTFA